MILLGLFMWALLADHPIIAILILLHMMLGDD